MGPVIYDDTIIYLVEVWGAGKPTLGVFKERRTAESWTRSLGDGVQKKVTQTHLLDSRFQHNLTVAI